MPHACTLFEVPDTHCTVAIQCNLDTGEEYIIESKENGLKVLYERPRFISTIRQLAIRPEGTTVSKVNTPRFPRNVRKKMVGNSDHEKLTRSSSIVAGITTNLPMRKDSFGPAVKPRTMYDLASNLVRELKSHFIRLVGIEEEVAATLPIVSRARPGASKQSNHGAEAEEV